MQLVAVPLYNRNMGEEAYIFRDLKSNNLYSTFQALNRFDGGAQCESLEMLEKVGLDAYTLGRPIFIPIVEINLIGNIAAQCSVPPEKIIFVIESPLTNVGLYLPCIQRLSEQGYRFAINYPIKHVPGDPVLQAASFIFLSHREERLAETAASLLYVKRFYRNLVPVAIHIYTREMFTSLLNKGFEFFECKVYKTTQRGEGVTPLKVNAIRLINSGDV